MKCFACLSILVSAVLLAGCPATGPAPPAQAKVSGTATLDGAPMAGGEARFMMAGQPAKVLEIRDGAFSGDVFVGKNSVDVVWEKDGPPHPMDPKAFIKLNTVDSKFSGVNSPFKPDITKEGAKDLKFEVTSASK